MRINRKIKIFALAFNSNSSMEGFEVIKTGNHAPAKPTANNNAALSKGDKAMDILSNNFDNILKLAGDIVDIEKMKVASEACLKKMAEDRKRIADEAQAYAVKKRADTNSVVDRMNVIRSIMDDFYAHSQGNLSGDDFCKIITEVVNQMGRIEDGIR